MKAHVYLVVGILAGCAGDAGFESPEAPEENAPVPEQLPIAAFDNDSLEDPAQDVFLRPTGDRQLAHQDEISFPDGDAADFVAFELPNNSNPSQRVTVTLDCALDGQENALVAAKLFEDGEATTKQVLCNEGPVQFTVDNTKQQTLRVAFTSVADPSYVDYTLTVVGFR